MKFTTPCFVRVDEAFTRDALIAWCSSIGYDTNTWQLPQSVCYVFADGNFAGRSGEKALASLPHNSIDCGTDIELFKALAAMNDENGYMQYFVYRPKGYLSHILGGWWLCTEQRWIDWAKPQFLNSMAFARKATAEEIIEHFKN